MRLHMRRFAKRAAALGLALLMTVTTAMASEAMGHELRGGVTPLSVGTSLANNVFWSDTYSDLRNERYTAYTPSRDVTPTVSYGSKVLSRATLTAMAQDLEAQGRRVVSGINGDYYVMATGAPLGMVITDGVLRSSSSWHLAVGFREDGSAFIGQPSLKITAQFGGSAYQVSGGINKVRKIHASDGSGGLVLLTSDFSATTQNTEPGVDVILTPSTNNLGQSVAGYGGYTLTQSDALIINGRVTCTVDQVLESTGSVSIPEGKIVMSFNAKDNPETLAALKALQPGDTVDIDVATDDSRWTEAAQAVGAMYKLVTNGQVVQPSSSSEKSAWAERTSRTAIGIKADGTVIFYTMDGRQSGYSVGCTLTQVAMRLVELGCVEAVSLDGGGSTTIGATLPGEDDFTILNKPSDGTPRSNSVAVFLTTDLAPTGELGSFYVTPTDSLLLAGASVQLTATALDTAYYPMDFSGDVTYFIYSGDGTVSTTGVYTAGSESGKSQVTAVYGENASGVTNIAVVKTPDAISVSNEATGAAVTTLNLSPGQQVNLKASSTYRNMALTSQDSCYTWTVSSGLGTIDSQGVFTASTAGGSGTITVSAGGRSATVAVNVAGRIHTLDTFEGGVSALASTETAQAEAETALDYVSRGRQSARVRYDASADGTASLGADLSVAEGDSYLGMWVYGDGSGNTLTATAADSGGAASSVVLTALDFTGWRHIRVALPAGAVRIQSLNIIYGGTGAQSGTLWLDQLTTANQDMTDTTAPTVTVTRSGSQVTATVADDVDQSFQANQITLTYDGGAIASSWDSASSTLTANLPASDGRAHRITVTAADASGNLGRASADITASEGMDHVFADMDGHWAEPYATYLYYAGVTSSVSTEATLFAPDRNITRGEFFTMAARWLGLDLNDYNDVALPFADADQIPSWAVNAVKAMYSLGILKGTESGGQLWANAGAAISRAEAMTILGRTQAKGYGENDLTFTDAADVPDWALSYVCSLVGQGVVNGTDNRINPNKSITRGEVAKLLYAML